MENSQFSISFKEAALPVLYGGVLGLPAALPGDAAGLRGKQHRKPHL